MTLRVYQRGELIDYLQAIMYQNANINDCPFPKLKLTSTGFYVDYGEHDIALQNWCKNYLPQNEHV
jgi:hypothetical protein